MGIYDKHEIGTVAVVGLGYVGLPLAVEFAKYYSVIGYDVNREKIAHYKNGESTLLEIKSDDVAGSGIVFTADEGELSKADFMVVAVPTPVRADDTPDLSPLISVSRTIGKNMSRGVVIVYESTVYPGVTEEVCLPLLEEKSGMKCGVDFKIGYSPERINPGDTVHTLTNIKKIVSGMDEETLDIIKGVYDRIITAGTYPVSSIKTAEAVKLIENSQRDINIAFMNEVAMAFDRMGIDTNEVVDGMNTKWNALGFRPGLVGGHCIGVDPYYFIYKAKQLGYDSRIAAAGRQLNNSVGYFVAEAAVKNMIRAGLDPGKANVVILGFTFKENCSDIRNTQVMNIISTLREYGIEPDVVDPFADRELILREYGITLTDMADVHDADCILHTVAHRQFREQGIGGLMSMFRRDGGRKRVLLDIKGEWPVEELEEQGVTWWRM